MNRKSYLYPYMYTGNVEEYENRIEYDEYK